MSERFANLKKISRDPARRLLALGNAKLSVDPGTPAAAGVSDVLTALEAQGAQVDILRVLSVALPARECIWWGCLAGDDLVGDGPVPATLAAARAWVFKPTDENREVARKALEMADVDDETSLVANAVVMCDGKVGPGEMAQFESPAGALGTFVFALNIASYTGATPDTFEAHGDVLIDRALDIARGGNGQIAKKASETEVSA